MKATDYLRYCDRKSQSTVLSCYFVSRFETFALNSVFFFKSHFCFQTVQEAEAGIDVDGLTDINQVMHHWFRGKCLLDSSWCWNAPRTFFWTTKKATTVNGFAFISDVYIHCVCIAIRRWRDRWEDTRIRRRRIKTFLWALFFLLSDDAVEIEGVEVLDHDQFTRFTIYSIRFVVFFLLLPYWEGGGWNLFSNWIAPKIYIIIERERER